jgi:invasion protein IalB
MAYRVLSSAATAAVLAAGMSLALVSGALAQTPAPKGKAAPAAAAPAAAPAAAAAPTGAQSAWVKLCEKAQLPKRGPDGKEMKAADGKDVIEEKNICLVHHEKIDGNTGMVIVSAAVRQVEGDAKQHLMVMVPLGMAIPPGIRAAVYTKDMWAKAQKNEKIDEKELKPIDLKFTLCHPAGCTAELEAPAGLIDTMKTGGGLMILAMNGAAQPIGFPVPLDGFGGAQAGAPVDSNLYGAERAKLMNQIAQRQEQLYKEYVEKQKLPANGGPAVVPAPAAPAKP